jgi:2-dehydro-3-deoxygluconokinase
VVKNGPNGALIAAAGSREHVPVPEVIEPVDATAAGDGFNAGYLSERLRGQSPLDAACAAHRLAGQVIRHRGAFTPRPDAAVH